MADSGYINSTQESNAVYVEFIVNTIIRDIIVDVLCIGACYLISVFGIVTNTISIVVYVKHGIKDSATVQFLSLSTSDCIHSMLIFMFSVSIFFGQVKPDLTAVDPTSFSYCITTAREKAYATSIIIIFLMSIERCFCVAFPFTVKRFFSKSRSIIAITCAALVFASFLIPDYLSTGLAWSFDSPLNKTRLMYWSSGSKPGSDLWKDIILAGILPVMSGITATVCAVYMISAIKASNKFRHFGLTENSQNSASRENEAHNGIKSPLAKLRKMKNDTRLTRTVITVDVVFIICNIPKCIVIASSAMPLFLPDFNFLASPKYHNIMAILYTITLTFEAINGACTFLIYYAFSTKFKETVDHTVRKCCHR